MKVTVVYHHDPADLSPIYLSVSNDLETPGEWRGAFCDTENAVRVVWAQFPEDSGAVVWLRDRHGQRRVETIPTS